MKLSFSFLLAFCLCNVFGQQEFIVKYIDEEISLDGVLNEKTWIQADYIGEFTQNFPTDTAAPEAPTIIQMAFDDKNLYIAITCFSIGENYIIPSLRRDFRAGGSDNITLIFNPFNDGTNAFFFGTNPLGIKREGLIANGGNDFRTGFITQWDNVWKCKAEIYDDRWVAEIAIPFTSLRFNIQTDRWSFNSYRFDTQTDERSTWVRIPRNQSITSLAQAGSMIWEKPLKAHSSIATFIPFVTSGVSKDFEDETDALYNFDIGGDAKINVTTGLNLDLTVNPDFSQVEVDQQITNLDRFEIFFPERRQFFIENADLFGNSGFSTINPFFSRRIGVAKDTSTGSNIQNRIYGGLRLNGKLNDNLRLGVLSMQTADDEANGLPSFNYSVTSLQQKFWNRSNVGFIFVNKQAVGSFDETEHDKYNRTAGIDFNYANEENSFRGKTFMHYSFSQTDDEKPFAHGLEFTSDLRKHEIQWRHEYVGEGYSPQVGFVRRNDYFRIQPSFNYKFYPSNSKINQHSVGIEYNAFWQLGNRKTDETISFRWFAQMPQFSMIFLSLNRNYVYLFEEFDPTGTDSKELEADTDYSYWSISGRYNTNQSKAFQLSISPTIGEYYNGFRLGLRGELSYRFQPYGSIGLNYSFNHFDMPYLEETRRTYLAGPKIDFTVNKSVFFTTFIQYNSQFKNTNINARLQWRYAPVSDIYLVYTDNYFTGNPDDPSDRFTIEPRNRALVLKMTYWLNM